MKTLSTTAASVALGVERKVLDNVLARDGRFLFAPGSRGKSRRIPVAVLERIAIAMVLNRDLGVGVANGLELAERILASPLSRVAVGSLSAIVFDVVRLRAELERSIAEALESVAEPARGRPR